MTIGLSLSGGGAKGVAHLGVLQAFEEAGIKISRIVGVSAGAIAGTFYAAGYKPRHILKFFSSQQILMFFRPAFGFQGLLDMDKTYNIYRVFFPDDSFETLDIPTTVAATEIHQGKLVFFDKGEIIRPIQASSCLPIVFKPIRIGGYYYIDGGTLDNLPIAPLVGKCDFTIGIHINPIGYLGKMNVKEIIERTFHLGAIANIAERSKSFDFFIEPPQLGNFTVYDITKLKEMYQVGYDYAKLLLPELLKKIEKAESKQKIEGNLIWKEIE
jgi:NTE family protein